MRIVSIYPGHNASIGYYEDGKLIYVLQEEKFNNIKNSVGFPYKSLQYLGEKVDLSGVDYFTMVGESVFPHLFDKNKIKEEVILTEGFHGTWKDSLMYTITKIFPSLYVGLQKKKLLKSKDDHIQVVKAAIDSVARSETNLSKIRFAGHHKSHAYSPIYFYGLHNSETPILIFTLDGMGDDCLCATVNIWENGELKIIESTPFIHSLGYIWSITTQGLGMKPLEHEYKVMGLAAYTSKKYYENTYKEVFEELIEIDGLQWKSKIPLNRVYMKLHKLFYGRRFDNIAGALQQLTEDRVVQWIKNAIKQTGIKKVAVSGGVFMNVKLNKVLQELEDIEKIYFMPSCGDESNVVGSIFETAWENKNERPKIVPPNTMYNGIRISDSDILSYIDKNGLTEKYTIENLNNDATSSKKIAELLAEHKIVAVCRGAGEWGARSLCNRAILANASSLANFHQVNDMIKMRDFWMPFAPAILEESAKKYIKNWDDIYSRAWESSQYMITANDSTPIAQKDLIAAIHQKDKTLRPQIVNTQNNPWMYTTLKHFESITGLSGVMNTSLNIHGYPLVGTVEQGMFTLENSGLQYILFNNILISKK